tara:strand:- start:66 stop:305 length:240 start_codon:yes stop_codon:yes gene_type:complete
MKQSWTRGLNPALTTEMRMSFASSLILRKRLAELLRVKERENYKANISKDDYDSPNWAAKKADSIGYARALLDIIDLIE